MRLEHIQLQYFRVIFLSRAVLSITVSAIDPKKIKFLNLPGTQGRLMSATVNQSISFTVDTSQAGVGNFNAQAVAEDGKIESFLMTSTQSGVYDLSYTPHTAGNLRFDFWYNDVIKFHSMNWICQMETEAKFAPAFSIHQTIKEEELQLTEVDVLWIQMTTFKNWLNDVLRGNLKMAKQQVEILQWDFRDGLLLITLLECLVKHSKISHCNPEPVNKMQKLENLEACFNFMEGKNIKLILVSAFVSIEQTWWQVLLEILKGSTINLEFFQVRAQIRKYLYK